MSRERGCESSLNLVDCSIGNNCGPSGWAAHTLGTLESSMRADLARLGLFDSALHRIQKWVSDEARTALSHVWSDRRLFGPPASEL